MDPLFTSSILASAERQAADRRWPGSPGDREMVTWSPGQQHPRPHPLAVAYRATTTFFVLVRGWLGRIAPASNAS